MIPKLQDILNVLDEIAPFSLAEEWDNPGLQVGHLSHEIKSILIALDPTVKAIRNASERKAQLLLTHHPLILKSLSSINPEIYPGDVVNEALKTGISIVSVHTNLDAAKSGINDILANLLGLQDVEVLSDRDNSSSNGIGIGRIGSLRVPMRLSDMVKVIKNALGMKGLMVMGHRDMYVKRIAVVGGSGGEMAPLALKKGAELLVTGDIKHHEALMAETLGLALIDAGHFRTERTAMVLFTGILKDRLKRYGWDIVLQIYEDEKEPMVYE